jgi:uracil-DNA glycosylase
MSAAAAESLTDPPALARRLAALGQARTLPLNRLVARLRAEHGRVPDFDPLDGGTDARLLVLLESPGPTIDRTGFVSRDNPTGTARNLRHFLDRAAVHRADTLIWNAVPWVIHAPGARNRAPRQAEIAAGLRELPGLLDLLPRLAAVVLAGRVVGQALAPLREARPRLRAVTMPHPSPTYVVTSPTVPARIAEALAEARRALEITRVSNESCL